MKVARSQRAIDQILLPVGFRRKGNIWNRYLEKYIDVISIQKSKSLNSITINISVCDSNIYSVCWQDKISGFIDESVCIFRIRIGEIVGDTDIWWDINDNNAAVEISEILNGPGLNILNNFHSNENLIIYLKDVVTLKPYYPLPTIYLSLLLISIGNKPEGIKLLIECRDRASAPWKDRIDKIVQNY